MKLALLTATLLISLNVMAETKPKTVHLTIALTDSSVLRGTCTDQKLKIRTAYARMELPLSKVASIAFSRDRESVSLQMQNKDKIKGSTEFASLKVKTILGEIDVPVKVIRSITVSMKKPKPGKGVLSAYIVEGKPTPNALKSQFVKDVPDALTKQFERVTRTANTSGSIVGRHGTYPWLYPIRGVYEIPRVFVEKGKRYYPIWGTWRQRLRDGWRTLDENGKHIKGVAKWAIPHWESKVDYLVVPNAVAHKGPTTL